MPDDDATQQLASPDRPLLAGRYRLGERLGGGGMAEVYRAHDERLDRPVAVKLFRTDASAEFAEHSDEVRMLARLEHPGLVSIYDASEGDPGRRPYLVLQLVQGPTLAEALREGPLSPERAARYGADLAAALAYVHDQGVVHRDIKPANVLVGPDDRVRLADFGIARIVDSPRRTASGLSIGTPAYFAPEQVANQHVGPPADIYALGLVLLEALTGHREYGDGTAVEVAMARLHRQPDVPATLSPGWRALLAAMTTRDPAERPSAHEVERRLRRFGAAEADSTQLLTGLAATNALTGPAAAAVPAPSGRYGAAPRSRPRVSPVAVLAGVLLLGIAVLIGLLVNTVQGDGVGDGPSLPGQLEQEMQDLERTVQP